MELDKSYAFRALKTDARKKWSQFGPRRIENTNSLQKRTIRRVVRLEQAIPTAILIGLFAVAVPIAKGATKEQHAMGSIPCAWSVPIQDKQHNLDVSATIQLLRANHFTCYVQPIEEKPPMSYEDFKRLLPAAQANGISVWPVLIPHTEGASIPYREDFVRWVKELADLSLKYSVLRGINIDDIDAGGNDKMFDRTYMCKIYQTKQDINPDLLFIPTIYDLDSEEADRFAGCVDGVWLWWTNLEQENGLRAFLEDSRVVAAGRFPVYAGIYAHSTSWHKQGSPMPKVFKKSLALGCRYSDGVILWQLPLTNNEVDNPLLKIAHEFTSAGGNPRTSLGCGTGKIQ